MRIMVVDDSKAMRSIVMRALRQAGYGTAEMVEACNGAEAYKAVLASPPNLVLADWNMPEMTGIELLEKLRGENCPVTLGFITSESDPDARARALGAGAAFILNKPIVADALKAAIASVLR